MSTLQVPGAELYFETVGDGPLIVFIPGAQGCAMVFQALAQQLRDRFTVLIYDRRGFSRSMLEGEQDYAQRLETDADDVARLIEHTGKGRATILGSSSGAIVALTVLARHPEVVETLIAHEPPASHHHPKGDALIAENLAIYDLYKAQGIGAAMQRFMRVWMQTPTSDHQVFAQTMSGTPAPQIVKNMTYWFEHEMRHYPPVQLDMAALKLEAARLVIGVGEEMQDPANPTTPIAHALSDKLEAPLRIFPGAHLGYAVKPEAFAQTLNHLLDERAAVAG
ncbi:alpha/beta hydrolase [Novosphingobium sp.]|uniref:alpha/beta fold hydrolase n=1 Tax=Novosphingobium sp. TaxID=1874826 RepID=UPI0031D861DB